MFAWLAGSIVKGIFGNVFGMVSDWLDHKRKIAGAKTLAKIEIEKARMQSAINISESKELHTQNWEILHAEGAKTSWKDEYSLIVISMPFLAYFVGLGYLSDQAFEGMKQAPEWYQYTFIALFLASAGIRVTDMLYKKLKGK